jgi:cation diffusion facilitator CzcD-associated flavoprotein CzcO
VDVLVVGAGLSGIGAGFRLRQQLPGVTFAVLEARDALGGTWDVFRYPGVRSDSAMFTFGYPFRPWREDRTMADGASIRAYLAATAREAGVLERVRLRTRVRSASWSSAQARWNVEADTADGPVTYRCRFLHLCTGYFDLDRGYRPDWPGLDGFAGPVLHPQSWPEGLELAGRRVVVIGSGATAVSLVPALAEAGADVTMLQRSPSYVLSMPATDGLAGPLRARLPARAADALLRAKSFLLIWGFHRFCRQAPGAARRLLRRRVLRALGDPAAVDEHFTPRYQPWDQRLCIVPEGDLFKVIADGRARVVTDRIERFVPDGIRLASGTTLPADVVVSATGLVLQAAGGIALTVDGEPVDVPGRYAYRGLMLSGVPNLMFCFGYTNASWTLRADLVSGYLVRLLRYLRRHGLDSATPLTPSQRPAPLLDLTSGYVRRGGHLFPVQGERGPWRVRQNALLERLVLPRADVTAAMSFARGGQR